MNVLFAHLEVAAQVTPRTVLHDDEDLSRLLVDDSILVADDVGVVEALEQVDLCH